MREVAKIALKQGLTQEGLAKKLGRESPTVLRHFKAMNPHDDTVRTYADALGVEREYLMLVHRERFEKKGVAPTADSERATLGEWIDFLAFQFDSPDLWDPKTPSAIRDWLCNLSDTEQRKHVREFALVFYREKHLNGGSEPAFAARAAFESYAPAEPYLKGRKRLLSPGDLSLRNIWSELAPRFNPAKFDVVLAVIAAFDKNDDIDTRPMMAALENDDLYQRWRDAYRASPASAPQEVFAKLAAGDIA